MIFEVLKAYLKRAPSLKGAALVKLSQLKIQVHPWPSFSNQSKIAAMLDKVHKLYPTAAPLYPYTYTSVLN